MGKFFAICFMVVSAVVAAFPAQAATFQTLYSFTGGADGAGPHGRMVYNAKTGMLYGTTLMGGNGGGGGGGTVFQFNPVTLELTTLYSFALGGLTGSNSQTPLILRKGILYGVTTRGGSVTSCAYSCGTIFKLDPATKILTTLYNFADGLDGATPEGGLVFDAAQSTLFGTTVQGGDASTCGGSGCGTVFQFVLAGKVFSTLHDFGAVNDGVRPTAGMVVDGSGLLYGTAPNGGSHGSGIVFRLDPTTSAYTVLHNFDYHVDGSGLTSDLLLSGGMLFGTTVSGGPTANGYGTIFSMDPAIGATTTLYSFTDGTDGIFPMGGLSAGPLKSIYGTASQGNSVGAGAIFSLNPGTNKFKTLHDFAGVGTDGASPSTGVVAVGQDLYGVTSYGNGTIFRITP